MSSRFVIGCLCGVIAALAVVLIVDRREDPSPAPPPAAAATAPGATAPATGAAPAPATAAAAPAAEDAARPEAFWPVLDTARHEAGGDVEDQFELVWKRLHDEGDDAMRAYADELHRRDVALYTWDLWGAATVIDDGCSDDCFDDFRLYVISLGPEAQRAALRDPDALADILPADADWGDARDSMRESYEALAGQEPPALSGLDGEPRGRPFDDEDEDALQARYPRLADRFG